MYLRPNGDGEGDAVAGHPFPPAKGAVLSPHSLYSTEGAPQTLAPVPSPPLRAPAHCVRRVKAALVMEVGRLSPLVISRHSFLLMTSTRPPFSVTSVYSMYRSSTCLAMMGIRFTGVPGERREERAGLGVLLSHPKRGRSCRDPCGAVEGLGGGSCSTLPPFHRPLLPPPWALQLRSAPNKGNRNSQFAATAPPWPSRFLGLSRHPATRVIYNGGGTIRL